VPTGDHASCDHTATTNGDGPALPIAPDDSRRHRQHHLSPLGYLDSSGATGKASPGEGVNGMTETTLPPWHATRLAVLLDALGSVPISDAERRSLVWLARFEAHTVENIAEVISRARQTR
jgi:hypothetical protein